MDPTKDPPSAHTGPDTVYGTTNPIYSVPNDAGFVDNGPGESVEAYIQRMAAMPRPPLTQPVAPYTPPAAVPTYTGKTPPSEPSFSAAIPVGQYGYGVVGAGVASTRGSLPTNADLYGAGKDFAARNDGYTSGLYQGKPVYDWDRPVSTSSSDYPVGASRQHYTARVPEPISSAAPVIYPASGSSPYPAAPSEATSSKWDARGVDLASMSTEELLAHVRSGRSLIRESTGTYATPIASTDTSSSYAGTRPGAGIGVGPAVVPSYLAAPLGSTAAQTTYDARARPADGSGGLTTKTYLSTLTGVTMPYTQMAQPPPLRTGPRDALGGMTGMGESKSHDEGAGKPLQPLASPESIPEAPLTSPAFVSRPPQPIPSAPAVPAAPEVDILGSDVALILYKAALQPGRPTALLTDEKLLRLAATTIRNFEQGDARAKSNHNYTSNDVRGMCNVILAIADHCDNPSASDFAYPELALPLIPLVLRLSQLVHKTFKADTELIHKCIDRLEMCLHKLFECPLEYDIDTVLPTDAGKKAATSIKRTCGANPTLAGFLVADARHMYMQGNAAMFKSEPWAKMGKNADCAMLCFYCLLVHHCAVGTSAEFVAAMLNRGKDCWPIRYTVFSPSSKWLSPRHYYHLTVNVCAAMGWGVPVDFFESTLGLLSSWASASVKSRWLSGSNDHVNVAARVHKELAALFATHNVQSFVERSKDFCRVLAARIGNDTVQTSELSYQLGANTLASMYGAATPAVRERFIANIATPCFNQVMNEVANPSYYWKNSVGKWLSAYMRGLQENPGLFQVFLGILMKQATTTPNLMKLVPPDVNMGLLLKTEAPFEEAYNSLRVCLANKGSEHFSNVIFEGKLDLMKANEAGVSWAALVDQLMERALAGKYTPPEITKLYAGSIMALLQGIATAAEAELRKKSRGALDALLLRVITGFCGVLSATLHSKSWAAVAWEQKDALHLIRSIMSSEPIAGLIPQLSQTTHVDLCGSSKINAFLHSQEAAQLQTVGAACLSPCYILMCKVLAYLSVESIASVDQPTLQLTRNLASECSKSLSVEFSSVSALTLARARHLLDRILAFTQPQRLVPVPELENAVQSIQRLAHLDSADAHYALFFDRREGNMGSRLTNLCGNIRATFVKCLQDIKDRNISKAEVSLLAKPSTVEYLNIMFRALGLGGGAGSAVAETAATTLVAQMNKITAEIESFVRVRVFLAQYNVMDARDAANIPAIEEETTLAMMEDLHHALQDNFRLSSDDLRALCHFAGKSRMFADRFGRAITTARTEHRSMDALVSQATRAALVQLQRLIGSTDAKISDFTTGVKLDELMEEMRRRNQTTIATELKYIQEFFFVGDGKGSDPDMVTSLQTRIAAVISLLQYQATLPAFWAAQHHLNMLPELNAAELQHNVAFGRLNENLVANAPAAVEEIRHALGGLKPDYLGLLAKLNRAAPAFAFLRREDQPSSDFNRLYNFALDRTGSNEHAHNVLMSLGRLRQTFQPVIRGNVNNLSDLARNLAPAILRIAGEPARFEDAVTSLGEDIDVVAEHWSAVEIYFHARADSLTADQVLEFVQTIVPKGRFYSCVGRLHGVSFRYRARAEETPVTGDVLEEQVQGAQLTEGSMKNLEHRRMLQDFVDAYTVAQQVHSVRLRLEAAGHPDHQNDAPTAIGAVASKRALSEEKDRLEAELRSWLTEVSQIYRTAPRLQSLTQRTLTRFVEAARQLKADNAPSARTLIGYVALCMGPSVAAHRATLLRTLEEAWVVASVAETAAHSDDMLFGSAMTQDAAAAGLALIRQLVAEVDRRMQELGICEPVTAADADSDDNKPSRIDAAVTDDVPESDRCYRLMMSCACATMTPVPAYPSQILWGSPSITAHQVKEWLRAASVQGYAEEVYVTDVNAMTASVREDLLQGILNKNFGAHPILLFSSDQGKETFMFLPNEEDAPNTASALLRKQCCALQSSVTADPGSPDTLRPVHRVDVVAGASGCGKSRWIERELATSKRTLTMVIHEGFSAKKAIEQYTKLSMAARLAAQTDGDATISFGIHVDVSPYADLEMLREFLHPMLTLGVLFDSSTGVAGVLDHDIQHHVYIELPALVAEASRPAWPEDATTFAPARHPFMAQLGSLAIACEASHFRAITPSNFDFIMDVDAKYVAAALSDGRYAHIQGLTAPAATAVLPPLPDLQSIVCTLSDAEGRGLLQQVWTDYGIPATMLARAQHMKVLATGVRYIGRMQAEVLRQTNKKQQVARHVRLYSQTLAELRAAGMNTKEVNRLGIFFSKKGDPYIPAYFHRVFKLMLRESAQLVRSQSHGGAGAPSTTVWTVRARKVGEFQVLVAGGVATDRRATVANAESVAQCQQVDLEAQDMGILRAALANAFGLRDTSDMLQMLRDAGYVLTPDFLVKLLELHGRKTSGASMILSGDTGVGKSQLLSLYSHLINADAGLFANMKLHLLNVVRAVAEAHAADEPYAALLKRSSETAAATNTATATPKFSFDSATSVAAIVELLMTVVRHDPENLANQIGGAIAAYFNVLLSNYPLQRDGLTDVARTVLERFNALREDENGRVKAVALARKAVLYGDARARKGRTIRGGLDAGADSDDDGDDESGSDDDSAAGTETAAAPIVDAAPTPAAPAPSIPAPAGAETDASALPAGIAAVSADHPMAALFAPDMAGPAPDAPTQLNTAVEAQRNLFNGENDFKAFLLGLLGARPARLFHRVLAHDGLTAQEWEHTMNDISAQAREIQTVCPQATVCVFVDECNTANALGMVAETFTRRSVNGNSLCDNMFFVGAINPHMATDAATPTDATIDFTSIRRGAAHQGAAVTQEFIVRPLPASLLPLVKEYPVLSKKSEECFLSTYMHDQVALQLHQGGAVAFRGIVPDEDIDETLFAAADAFRKTAVEAILSAQELVKSYRLRRVKVSIRDLLRATKLFRWILEQQIPLEKEEQGRAVVTQTINPFIPEGTITASYYEDTSGEASERIWQALLMSIAVVYYFRLPSQGHVGMKLAAEDFRARFATEMGARISKLSSSAPRFQVVVKQSLDHLWKYCAPALPRGLAHTTALKENVYCIILAVSTATPLLITGPPGCGKTLAFTLVSNLLKGSSAPASTPLLKKLKNLVVRSYACSEHSTAAEINAVYHRALDQKRDADRLLGAGHDAVCVFLDEAGLPPEKYQALKALHDFLDDPNGVASVLLSNFTLDAAKTNRCIQLLQTQANTEDLRELAEGILIPRAGTFDDSYAVENMRMQLKPSIEGLCRAFQQANDSCPDCPWFDTRDFVYLCRFIQRASPLAAFSADVLLEGLRRNFSTKDVTRFPILAKRFLEACKLFEREDRHDLDAHPLDTIIKSINDHYEGDPAGVPFRHTMIVDPTESNSARDLLFSLNILGQNTEEVFICDFAEDSNPTKRAEALARVKRAVSRGHTLLIVNGSSIFSALYDVFNRHYQDAVNNGVRKYYANLALGSFSTLVEVHPNFRVIVHLAASAVPRTPLPLLNRFSKFTLSLSDVLQQKISQVAASPPACINSIPSVAERQWLFRVFRESLEHFVAEAGQETFYGFTPNETIPAMVLKVIEDCRNLSSPVFRINEPLHVRMLADKEEDDFEAAPTPTHTGAPIMNRLRQFNRVLNYLMLMLAKPEEVFRLRERLSDAYLKEYVVKQEHFSVVNAIRPLIARSQRPSASAEDAPGSQDVDMADQRKLMIFTRTCSQVTGLRQQARLAERLLHCKCFNLNSAENSARSTSEGLSVPASAECVLLHLASCSSSVQVDNLLKAYTGAQSEAGQLAMLVVVADMSLCSALQVAYTRNAVDRELGEVHRRADASGATARPPNVVFVLHIPPERMHLRSCYQAVTLNGWDFMYCDSFSADDTDTEKDDEETVEAAADPRSWLQVAYRLKDLPHVVEAQAEFGALVQRALMSVIAGSKFTANKPEGMLRRTGVVGSTPCYKMGSGHGGVAWVQQLVSARPWLTQTLLTGFTTMWGGLLDRTAAQVCSRLTQGTNTHGFLRSIRLAQKWLLNDYLMQLVRRDLAADYGFESLCQTPHGAPSDDAQVKFISALLRSVEAPISGELAAQIAGVGISHTVPCAPLTPMFKTLRKHMKVLHSHVSQAACRAQAAGGNGLDGMRLLLTQYMQVLWARQSPVEELELRQLKALSDALSTLGSDPEMLRKFVQDYVLIVLGHAGKAPVVRSCLIEAAAAISDAMARDLSATSGQQFRREQRDDNGLEHADAAGLFHPALRVPLIYSMTTDLQAALSSLLPMLEPFHKLLAADDEPLLQAAIRSTLLEEPMSAVNAPEESGTREESERSEAEEDAQMQRLSAATIARLRSRLLKIGLHRAWEQLKDVSERATGGEAIEDDEVADLVACVRLLRTGALASAANSLHAVDNIHGAVCVVSLFILGLSSGAERTQLLASLHPLSSWEALTNHAAPLPTLGLALIGKLAASGNAILTEEVLRWFGDSLASSEELLDVVTHGLLNLPLGADSSIAWDGCEVATRVVASAIGSLPGSVRVQFIQSMRPQLDASLNAALLPYAKFSGAEGLVAGYIPSFVLAAENLQSQDVFRAAADTAGNKPRSYLTFEGPGADASAIAYQAIAANTSGNEDAAEGMESPLDAAAASFMDVLGRCRAREPLPAMIAAARGVRLASAVAAELKDMVTVSKDVARARVRAAAVLEAVNELVQLRPLGWSTYILTQVDGLENVVKLLGDRQVLHELGMPWWYSSKAAEETAAPSAGDAPADDAPQLVALLPFMIRREDPWFDDFWTVANLLQKPSLRVAEVINWATHIGQGPADKAWRARGFLIVALYHYVFVRRRTCGAVKGWAQRAAAGDSQPAATRLPAAARLHLTPDECRFFCLLADGPVAYPPALVATERECGFAWLFSIEAMNLKAESQRNNAAIERSAYIAALAMCLGSPRGRLYFQTPLLEPQMMGPGLGNSFGLGSGSGTLAKDCGLQVEVEGGSWRFEDHTPQIVPYEGDTLCRLLNNAFITIGWSWNTAFFQERTQLYQDNDLFLYARSREDLMGFDADRFPAAANMIYAYARASTFFQLFQATVAAVQSEHVQAGSEPLLVWGGACQAAWAAALDTTGCPALQATYPHNQPGVLTRMQDSMRALRLRWQTAFGQEPLVRQAYRESLGAELRKRVAAIERSRSAVAFFRKHVTAPSIEDVLSALHQAAPPDRDPDAAADDEDAGAEERAPPAPVSFEQNVAKVLLALLEEHRGGLLLIKHVPLLIAINQFATEAFAFRFTEEQARSITVEEALLELPASQRIIGQQLFKQFLKAWNELRTVWGTYIVCPRARNEAEIPLLTDHRGDRPALVADLVSLLPPSSTEEESCPPLRMLDKRFVDLQRRILNSRALAAIRESDGNAFNRSGWLAEESAVTDDMINLPQVDVEFRQVFINGTLPDCDQQTTHSYFIDLACAHASFRVTQAWIDAPPEPDGPPPEEIRRLQQAEAVELGRRNQELAYAAGTWLLCDRCNRIIERMEGCDLMICGRDYHNEGATVRGCGNALKNTTHRVPKPPPVLPIFMPEGLPPLPPSAMPARPVLPPVPLPSGRWEFDFLPAAREALAMLVAGKKLWELQTRKQLPLRSVNLPSAAAHGPEQQDETPDGGDPLARLQMASERLRVRFLSEESARDTTLLSEDISLPTDEQTRVDTILRRQPTEMLALWAEDLLAICAAALQMTSLENMLVRDAMDAAVAPRTRWNEMLVKNFGEQRVARLPAYVDVLTSVYNDRGFDSEPSLNSRLPRSEATRFEDLLSGLTHYDASTQLEVCRAFRDLSSVMNESFDILLRADHLMPLNTVPILMRFKSSGHEATQSLLDSDILRVCHFGPVMRYLKRASGVLFELARNKHDAERATSDAPATYTEYVPQKFEQQQVMETVAVPTHMDEMGVPTEANAARKPARRTLGRRMKASAPSAADPLLPSSPTGATYGQEEEYFQPQTSMPSLGLASSLPVKPVAPKRTLGRAAPKLASRNAVRVQSPPANDTLPSAAAPPIPAAVEKIEVLEPFVIVPLVPVLPFDDVHVKASLLTEVDIQYLATAGALVLWGQQPNQRIRVPSWHQLPEKLIRLQQIASDLLASDPVLADYSPEEVLAFARDECTAEGVRIFTAKLTSSTPPQEVCVLSEYQAKFPQGIRIVFQEDDEEPSAAAPVTTPARTPGSSPAPATPVATTPPVFAVPIASTVTPHTTPPHAVPVAIPSPHVSPSLLPQAGSPFMTATPVSLSPAIVPSVLAFDVSTFALITSLSVDDVNYAVQYLPESVLVRTDTEVKLAIPAAQRALDELLLPIDSPEVAHNPFGQPIEALLPAIPSLRAMRRSDGKACIITPAWIDVLRAAAASR